VGTGGLAQRRAMALGACAIRIWPNGPWAIFNGVRVSAAQVGRTVAEGRPVQPFSFIHFFSNNFKAPISKIQITLLVNSNTFQIWQVDRKFQTNKLPFWLDFQFPLDFELKI
jgi:hypothetical protein